MAFCFGCIINEEHRDEASRRQYHCEPVRPKQSQGFRDIYLGDAMLKNILCIFGLIISLCILSLLSQAQEEPIIISNPKTPTGKNGKSIRIVFAEELTIGVTKGDKNYMFGGRVYFNTDEKGNFYVNDWDAKRIIKYDPDGKYVRTIGRAGQGPGEFQNVWTPRFDKDNNLYVSDLVGRRINFFNPDGNFLRQVIMSQRLSNVFVNAKGNYVASQSIYLEDERRDRNITVIGIFDEEFNLVSEIYRHTWVPPKRSTGRDRGSRAQFTADILSDSAFKPDHTFFVSDDDFIYFGYPEQYEICVYSPEGRLVRTIKREYDPIKVSEKHKEEYFRLQEAEFFRFVPHDEEYKKRVKGLIRYPKYKPAYEHFVLMENGWLLVVVDSIAGEYTLFDVFDENYRYIAQFKATIPEEELFFRNRKAYAVATEDSYKFVKRYNFEIQEYRD